MFISVNNEDGMRNIEEFKFGNNRLFEDDVQEFTSCKCDNCDMCLAGAPRYICISCKPGPNMEGGWVDICNGCMNTWRKEPKNSTKNIQFRENLIQSVGHDSETHVFLRVFFGNPQTYYDF